jgi:hypothetical protein
MLGGDESREQGRVVVCEPVPGMGNVYRVPADPPEVGVDSQPDAPGWHSFRRSPWG